MGGDTEGGGTPPASQVEQGQRSFYARLPGAFVYPFKGLGWAAIIAGAVFFWLVDHVAALPSYGMFAVFGVLLLGLAAGYLCAFMIKVLGASAGGQDAPPDWPDLTNYWDDIVKPLLLIVAAFVFSFLPLIVYALVVGGGQWRDALRAAFGLIPGANAPSLGALRALLALGLAYLPMALIGVALFDSPGALNPVLVVRGIIRTLPAYIVATILFLVVYAVSWLMQAFVSGLVPIIGPLLAGTVSLYFLMVEMHILGLLYHTHAKRLGWFE